MADLEGFAVVAVSIPNGAGKVRTIEARRRMFMRFARRPMFTASVNSVCSSPCLLRDEPQSIEAPEPRSILDTGASFMARRADVRTLM